MNLGRYLAELRQARHLTKADLSRLLEVHWNAVNAWEKGRSCPKPAMLARIVGSLVLTEEETARLAVLAKEHEQANKSAEVPHGNTSADQRAHLSDLLGMALVPGRHTIDDAYAVLEELTRDAEATALTATLRSPIQAATHWLDGAATLRRRGVRITAHTLTVIVADLLDNRDAATTAPIPPPQSARGAEK